MNQHNGNGERHGHWESYWENGTLDYSGTYHNGERHGEWESYYSDGTTYFKRNYVYGRPIGFSEENLLGIKYKEFHL